MVLWPMYNCRVKPVVENDFKKYWSRFEGKNIHDIINDDYRLQLHF
jgi:hypothetical protein